jgi:hypothetical protein
MPSGFNYYVFGERGDLAIADPNEEARCPYPKSAVVDDAAFTAAVDALWRRFSLDAPRPIGDSTSANAFNVKQILLGTLPGRRICAYHLGRGIAAALLEVLTGFPGDQYGPLVPPLNALIADVVASASPAFTLEAQEWFTRFATVSAQGGSRAFSELWNASNPLASKVQRRRHWWQ